MLQTSHQTLQFVLQTSNKNPATTMTSYGDESKRRDLYGGSRPWSPTDWTASDDRVRGGASTSFIEAHPSGPIATFLGHLDTTALGGAGFASQRTTTTTPLDLSIYDGIELDVVKSDGRKYTLIVKDEILPLREDGREKSSVSWEFDFVVEKEETGRVWVPWEKMEATFRGRKVDGERPLKRGEVRRLSLMMRSFFGQQEGNFQLGVRSIIAVKLGNNGKEGKTEMRNSIDTEDLKNTDAVPGKQSWRDWILGLVGCANQ